MEQNKKIYGTLLGNEEISFALDGFCCVFFKTKNAELICVKSNNSFIVGKTTEEEYVYIHCKSDIRIRNKVTLNTWFYFISKNATATKFDSISFQGGILNKLFYKSALDFDYGESLSHKIIYKDDRQRYQLSGEQIKGSLVVKSIVRECMSVESGNSIEVAGTELALEFDEAKNICCFSNIYNYVLNMCQFMAFRKNVGFDTIILKLKSQDYPDYYEEFAKCYIKKENVSDTEKSIYKCITFNILDECVGSLFQLIVDNKVAKPKFSLGYLPENDKDANVISSIKIREICSALESELTIKKQQVKKNKEFDNLISELKKIVKNHKESDSPLSEPKAYDYIMGTLRHMQGALADRIESCFNECYTLIGESCTRKQIDDIIKYRNVITHGDYMPLDEELVETTYVFINLVYCCILKRSGLADNKIRELLVEKMIVS